MISSLIPETNLVKTTGASASHTESNLPSVHAASLTIDENAMGKLIGMLTNLYSDENLAVLREYSTNAYDSHVAAGNTAPIEVELPSALNPQLVIRDFGLGLSKDDMINVYSKYGSSTKSLSMDQVGAFGLGCKSGLSLATQFTVMGVKDGIKTVTVISQGNDGTPGYSVVSETATDEPNGVTVRIAVPNPSLMRDRATAFFTTWKPGTVLVDGEAPKSVWTSDNEYYSRDGLLIAPRQGGYWNESHYVVMGNVRYAVTLDELDIPDHVRQAMRTVTFYIEVPIGSVDLPPNREAIRYSAPTKRFLSALYLNIYKEMRDIILDDVDKSESLNAAVKSVIRWDKSTSFVKLEDYTYNGAPMVWTDDFKYQTVNYVAPRGGKNRGDMAFARRVMGDDKQINYYYLAHNAEYVYIQCADLVEKQSLVNVLRFYVKATDAWEKRVLIGCDAAPQTMKDLLNLEIISGKDAIAKAKEYAAEQRRWNAASPEGNKKRKAREKVAVTYNVRSVSGKDITNENLTLDDIAKLKGPVFHARAAQTDNYYLNVYLNQHVAASGAPLHIILLSSGQRTASVTSALPKAQEVKFGYSVPSVLNTYTKENLNVSQDIKDSLVVFDNLDYEYRRGLTNLAAVSKNVAASNEIDDDIKSVIALIAHNDNQDMGISREIQALLVKENADSQTAKDLRKKVVTLIKSLPFLTESYGAASHAEHAVDYIKAFAKIA